MRGMDHVGRDEEILVDEFGAQRIVRHDAADFGRRMKYDLGLVLANRRLVAD